MALNHGLTDLYLDQNKKRWTPWSRAIHTLNTLHFYVRNKGTFSFISYYLEATPTKITVLKLGLVAHFWLICCGSLDSLACSRCQCGYKLSPYCILRSSIRNSGVCRKLDFCASKLHFQRVLTSTPGGGQENSFLNNLVMVVMVKK